MKVHRFGLFIMLLAVLAANWAATMWWLSGGSLATAWASGAAQVEPQAVDETQAITAIPRTFSYQGTLRGADGNLLNGSVKITLHIYNVVSGGAALYSEIFDPVVVRSGHFSVVVGDQAGNAIPANLFNNERLYLGIAVGDDAEMTPRQRLHPVPWAMQASTAQSAVTANSLVQGGGVPGIVTFGAGGAKEITFVGGGKIVDSATGMTITGAGGGQAVSLPGNVAVGGDLTVNGDWSAGAILDKGDSNGGQNQRSTYPVSINRYVVEAPDNGASPDTVPLDDAILVSLCQDEDGCTFTLGMRNWIPGRGNSDKSMLATVGPARFSLSPVDQGKRWWSSRNWTGGAGVAAPADVSVVTDAQDGDGSHQHVARAWDCYFTDGSFVNAQANDSQVGFGLLNWHVDFTSIDMTCVLIIED
jgi:hypothetical protein